MTIILLLYTYNNKSIIILRCSNFSSLVKKQLLKKRNFVGFILLLTVEISTLHIRGQSNHYPVNSIVGNMSVLDNPQNEDITLCMMVS